MINQLEFDEHFYLLHNPDVLDAIKIGKIENAYVHYTLHGEKERRICRKSIDNKFLKNGFKTYSNKLCFYSLVQNPEFIRIISADNYMELLAEEMINFSPKIILESLA